MWAGVELLLPLLLGTTLHWSLLDSFTALVRHDRRHPCCCGHQLGRVRVALGLGSRCWPGLAVVVD